MTGRELSEQEALTHEFLPVILERVDMEPWRAIPALCEMMASLCDLGGDPQTRRGLQEIVTQTLKERFAWSDEGGTA